VSCNGVRQAVLAAQLIADLLEFPGQIGGFNGEESVTAGFLRQVLEDFVAPGMDSIPVGADGIDDGFRLCAIERASSRECWLKLS